MVGDASPPCARTEVLLPRGCCNYFPKVGDTGIEQGSGVTRGKGVEASCMDPGWGAKGKKHAPQHAGSKLERFRRRQNLRDRSGEKKSCQLKAVLVGLAAAAPPAEPAPAGDAGADTVVDGAF